MKNGFLDRAALEKDIEQIKFYAEEEKEKLAKIREQIERCTENYDSQNTKLILESIENYGQNVEKFYDKRLSYMLVLKNAIALYEDLGQKTVERFNGDI